MKDEYIIINKTELDKKIVTLEGYTDEPEVTQLRLYKEIISQSTPLIPESIKPLQKLIDEGYDPYDSAHHLQVQRMLKVIQDYISNLKLDI